MRNLAIFSAGLFVVSLALGPAIWAQGPPAVNKPGLEVPVVIPGPGWKTCPRCKNDDRAAADRAKAQVDTHKFDPHDLTGVWSGNPSDLGANGTTLNIKGVPPFTPYGQKLADADISDSPEWNSKDPMDICDPLGYPRSYTYNYGVEFIQLPGRTLEFFELTHYWRDIWTDGRKLPPNPPIPRFYGYAVGHWEGDTFVVESNGYDDRSWIEQDQRKQNAKKSQGGFPHSDEMQVVERYKRLNYGMLQVELTITDPKVYTAPWKSGPSLITLSPDSELGEHTCVPSDQIEYDKLNVVPTLSTGSTGH